ncbi:Pentatricopeptide repeat [Dillenia turbinata]|uniref:Pentatricopeptide repeat n=1 Tax=Dillenia turbinata TaxID=194707 RepID=A0AAN8W3Y6_9MAGN
MALYLSKFIKPSNAHFLPNLRSNYFLHGQLFTTDSISLNHEQILRRGGIRRQQMCFSHCCSLSMSRSHHHCPNRTLSPPRFQIPHILSHPFSLSLLFPRQKTLLNNPTSHHSLPPKNSLVSCAGVSNDPYLWEPRSSSGVNHNGLSNHAYLSNPRCFSSDSDEGSDSDGEIDGGIEGGDISRVKSSADPMEVDRVYKVIDELFALDRSMEAVLDQCGIQLSHDLVVDVLERFRHARKPAFWFFSWAATKPGFEHDSRTYNSMFAILGRTRQFETMVSMLDEMGEKGVLNMETFIIAIRAFAASKERKKAVGLFELMKKHKFKIGVDTINCLLGRAKLGKEAQKLFETLEGRFTPNLQTYSVLLNGWCRLKNLLEAGTVWNEMIDNGFKPDIVAHNTMIEGLLKAKRRSDASKLFMVMKAKGPNPNVRTFTIMIRDLCKQGTMEQAVGYFYEMLDSGCKPDAAVYTSLMTGYGNLKRMDKVYRLLVEMKDKGCPPDAHTYNALIKLMSNRRMPDDSVMIYKKMIQNGIEPTIHTYNMMMKSYFQTRNYEMGLIRYGKSKEACRYIEEMIEKGMKAPQLDYNKFAADFSQAGRPDILEELARKMKFAGKFEVANFFARWVR